MGPVLVKEEKKSGKKQATVKQPKKVTIKNDGICAVCKSSNYCTFSANGKRTVTHCEEWEGFETRQTAAVIPDLNGALKRIIKQGSGERQTSTGLCQYCTLQETCTYPKKEGGIWVCDEYEEDMQRGV